MDGLSEEEIEFHYEQLKLRIEAYEIAWTAKKGPPEGISNLLLNLLFSIEASKENDFASKEGILKIITYYRDDGTKEKVEEYYTKEDVLKNSIYKGVVYLNNKEEVLKEEFFDISGKLIKKK